MKLQYNLAFLMFFVTLTCVMIVYGMNATPIDVHQVSDHSNDSFKMKGRATDEDIAKMEAQKSLLNLVVGVGCLSGLVASTHIYILWRRSRRRKGVIKPIV